MPNGASLSAGIDNGDGSWTLTPGELDGLTITPPQDYAGEFELTVTATSTDGDSTATTTDTFTVSTTAVADTPELAVNDAGGLEDTAIRLDVSSVLTDTDGSESLSLTISNVPNGASLSAGIDNGDGSWTLTPGELDGLSITPPQNYAGEFELTVTATSTDGDSTATTTDTFTVSTTAVADTPELAVNDAGGLEDTAIRLDL